MFEDTPRVLCKLRDEFDLGDDVRADWIWSRVLERARLPLDHAVLATSRLFKSSTAAELREFTRTVDLSGRESGGRTDYRRANLNSWLVLTLGAASRPSRLVAELKALDRVETAYVDPNSELPGPVKSGNDPLFAEQDYLNPAEGGIDIGAAWRAGADGTGVMFADVEKDWSLQHLDLQDQPVNEVTEPKVTEPPHPSTPETEHGTKILEIVMAADNTIFTIGMAPKITGALVASIAHTHRADAIQKAADQLRKFGGGVLLIELQLEGSLAPVEASQAEFTVISQAAFQSASTPIVVVECAGNGDLNLDELQVASELGAPGRSLRRSPNHDSGAIMVGAVKSGLVQQKWEQSNFGGRVDCCAWGENVRTTFGDFGGTSAAGAIIAGACCVVQSARKRRCQPFLTSVEMRSLLTQFPTVRPLAQSPTKGDTLIGSIPDLAQIMGALDS